ncbi:sulfatase [Pontiellaceae bacterium B12227]|nr:sulfatase [Pontiellaceae bacterium B12227]
MKLTAYLMGMTALCVMCSHADQPNIVYLMADDLGWVDIAFSAANMGHGSQYHETPNIDRLAGEGLCFTQAYVQQNCQPTRAALLTGQYAVRPLNNTYNVQSLARYDKRSKGWPKIPIQPYAQQQGGIDPSSTSIFEMLQAAGYHTAWFGKNHGCGADDDLPKNHGIDYNFGSNKKAVGKVNGKKTTSNYLALKDDSKGWIFDGPMAKYAAPYTAEYAMKNLFPFANGNDPMRAVGTPKHYTDALGDAVAEYLADRAKDKTPFIAYVPFHAIHSGIVARPDLFEKYQAKPSSDERHTNAKYAAFVEQLDQTVGRILLALEQNGLAANTLVVFTSDNGGVKGATSNAPLRSAKGTYYEGGLRVPFIARWPGKVTPGTVSAQPIHCIDIYPTFAELTGGSQPDPDFQPLDGVSFRSILLGDADALERESLFWHFPGYMDERNHPRSLVQTRIGNEIYKLFFNYTDGSYELYNISKDLSEANNLLAVPGERSMIIAKEMNRDLRNWLLDNQAPNGSWRINGNDVSYPSVDMLSYEIPDQAGLKPIKKKPKNK